MKNSLHLKGSIKLDWSSLPDFWRPGKGGSGMG